MKIIKITPCGFCEGVITAYNKTKLIAKKHKNKDIYLIGWLVHNENVIDELKSMNIKILNGNKSRIDFVKSIKKKAVVIFSAHGTDQQAIKLAKENGHIVYDLTCQYVKKIFKSIRTSIRNNKKIIYLGKHNHPEAIAALSIDKKVIKLVENEDDLKKLNFKTYDKIIVLNQSTINLENYKNLLNKLKNKYPAIEISTKICNATEMRQKAIKNKINQIDLLLVVGDKKSNNCNELVNIGLENNIKSYLINSERQIKNDWLKKSKVIGITAGASTPDYAIKSVIKYLNEVNKC